jgi:hypothetical protein
MLEKRSEMENLRELGYTYQQIGEMYGVSKQRVYQIIGKSNEKYFRYKDENSVVFVGLRDWMNENKVSINALCRKIYRNAHPVLVSKVINWLNGKNDIKLSVVKKILEVTGLTFEQAFRVEK